MIDFVDILFALAITGVAVLLLALCKIASSADAPYNSTAYKDAMYWDRISTIADMQRQKGIETYGQTIEQNRDVDAAKRITMLEEELVDALMYLEWLRDGLDDTRGN